MANQHLRVNTSQKLLSKYIPVDVAQNLQILIGTLTGREAARPGRGGSLSRSVRRSSANKLVLPLPEASRFSSRGRLMEESLPVVEHDVCPICERIVLDVIKNLSPVTPNFNVDKDARQGVQLANIFSFRAPQN